MSRRIKSNFRKSLSYLLVMALSLTAIVLYAPKTVEAATQAEAVAWANAQIGKGLDYDGMYGNQCVDLIKYYYAFFGVAGYASGNANAYISNNLPAGWSRVYGNYQPGDIAVWKTNYSSKTCKTTAYGHVGIIESADAVGFNAVNQNYNYNTTCTKNWFYCSDLACAIRPSFYVPPADTQRPSITNVKVTNVNAKGYTVSCTITDNVGVTKVQFPTWRTRNTSAGCAWPNSTSVNGSTYTFTFSGALYDDYYTTHIYAWDAAGNDACAGAGDTLCCHEKVERLHIIGLPDKVGDTSGPFAIASMRDENKVLDVANASTANGANIQIYDKNDSDAQKYTFTRADENYFYITNVNSGKVLDVANGKAASGTNLMQNQYNGTDGQMFKLGLAEHGGYYIISKLGTTINLYDSVENGHNVNLWQFDYSSEAGIKNKSWTLIPMEKKTEDSNRLYLKENAPYAIDEENGELDLPAAVTVGEFKNNITNSAVEIKNKSGVELSDEDIIGTGSTVTAGNDQEKRSYVYIVKGDVSGDGEIGTMDITIMARSIVGIVPLDENQKKAGDVVGDNKINNKDIGKIMKVLAGVTQSL